MGAMLLPQCLHLRASLRTTSRHSGQWRWVSAVYAGWPLSPLGTSATSRPINTGDSTSASMNHANPLRLRVVASTPTTTAPTNHTTSINSTRIPSAAPGPSAQRPQPTKTAAGPSRGLPMRVRNERGIGLFNGFSKGVM